MAASALQTHFMANLNLKYKFDCVCVFVGCFEVSNIEMFGVDLCRGFPCQMSQSLHRLITTSEKKQIFAVECFISAHQIYAQLVYLDYWLWMLSMHYFLRRRGCMTSVPHISVVFFLNSSRSILYPIPWNQSWIWHSGWNFGGIQLWIQMEFGWNPVKISRWDPDGIQVRSRWNFHRIQVKISPLLV